MNELTNQPIIFPDPRSHRYKKWVTAGGYYYDAGDILLFGGEMTLENLRAAYRRGIFPWAIDGLPLPWFCPEWRAILEFDDLRVGKTLKKERAKNLFRFTIDRDFPAVIQKCARVRRAGQRGTWISEDFVRAYTLLHEAGDAHSVEAWDAATGELVGGLYGVDAGGAFCGESMFHTRSNASKLALLFLIEHLQARGAQWLDVQLMTPHFAALGATELVRGEFLDKLEKTLAQNLKLF